MNNKRAEVKVFLYLYLYLYLVLYFVLFHKQTQKDNQIQAENLQKYNT